MIFGAALSYKVILPITFRILMWFVRSAGAEPIFHVSDFVNIIVTLMIGVGLIYSSPIFVILLVERGVLTSSQISKNRRIVYLVFIIVAAVLTPDPTILSDIILFAPFAIIYEAVIYISKRVEKRRAIQ
jgi:sec-independent protein translocase protein TatC